jgi:hypothetical protein
MNPILARLTAADRIPLFDRLENAATDADRAAIVLMAYDGNPPPSAILELIEAGFATGNPRAPGADGPRWIITLGGISGLGTDLKSASADWTANALIATLHAAADCILDPPGDDDTSLIIAAQRQLHLSPDPRQRAEAGELLAFLTHSPKAEDAA